MSQEWYYAQGGVQKGPVSIEQLKALLDCGQLRSSDLVWHDGMDHWTQAAAVEGLVPKQPSAVALPSSSTSPSPEWYYAEAGQQKGPVTVQHFQALAASGQLQPNTLVWRDGMSDWVKAGTVPRLFPEVQSAAPPMPHTSAPPLPQTPTLPLPGGMGRTLLQRVPKWVWGCVGVIVVLFGGIRGCLQAGGGRKGEVANHRISSPDKTQHSDNSHNTAWVLKATTQEAKELLSDLNLDWVQKEQNTTDGNVFESWEGIRRRGTTLVVAKLITHNDVAVQLQLGFGGGTDKELAESYIQTSRSAGVALTGWTDCRTWLMEAIGKVTGHKGDHEQRTVQNGIRVTVHKVNDVMIIQFASDAMLKNTGK